MMLHANSNRLYAFILPILSFALSKCPIAHLVALFCLSCLFGFLFPVLSGWSCLIAFLDDSVNQLRYALFQLVTLEKNRNLSQTFGPVAPCVAINSC